MSGKNDSKDCPQNKEAINSAVRDFMQRIEEAIEYGYGEVELRVMVIDGKCKRTQACFKLDRKF